MSDSSSDNSSSASESGSTTTGIGTSTTGTTTTTGTATTTATGATTATESTTTAPNPKRATSKLVSFMNHKGPDGNESSSDSSSSSDSDSDSDTSSSDSSSDSDDTSKAAAAQHSASAVAAATRVFTKPAPPPPAAVAAPPATATKPQAAPAYPPQHPAVQKAGEAKGPTAPQQAAPATRLKPPPGEPMKVALPSESDSDSDSDDSSDSSSEATTSTGATTTTATSGSGSTETSGTTTTSATTTTTTTTTTATSASKSLSTATADAANQRPTSGKLPSVSVVRVESPTTTTAGGPSRPAAGAVPPLPLTQAQPQAAMSSSMVLKEESDDDDEHSRGASTKKPGEAVAATLGAAVTQGGQKDGGAPASTLPSATAAQGDARPESTANLRYHGDQEPSSSDEEESSSTESAASEDSTIVDADTTAKPPRPSKPSVAVRTVRETETIAVAASTRPEYTLPMELMVVAGTTSDVFTELCDHALAAQESMLRNANEDGGAAGAAQERPVDAPPPNHLTLGNAFLLCRATGLGDHESAKLLFGCAMSVEVPFLRALVEQQAEKRLTETLFDAFRQRDPTHSGELPKAVVLRLIEASGCCSRSVARGTFHVHVRPIAGSLFALSKHTVFGSDPPQRRESSVDLSAKNFQMFVDQVRGEVTCNGQPVCSLELTPEYLAEIVQAMQMCVYVNSMVESCETELDGTIVYEPLLNAILTNKPPPMLWSGGSGMIDLPTQQPAVQQKRYRSILLDNALRSTFRPLTAFDDGLRAAVSVEPFLQRSVVSPQQRRVNYVPRSLVGEGADEALRADEKNPSNSNRAANAAAAAAPQPPSEKCVRYFSLWVETVHIPNVEIPVSASRYLLISVVSADNVVLPCVRVDAKARKPGEKPTDPWTFSKKKICNNVLVAGEETDAVYVEVCFDVLPSSAADLSSASASRRTVCGGFAACSLRDFGSGTLSVKPGTFFRKQQALAADGGASDKSVESSSCFCFAAQPATKIVVAADRLSDPPSVCASLMQDNARCVVLERHVKLIAGFRDFLQNPRRLRSQAATALFRLLDHGSVVDQLCTCWELESMTFSKDQRRDKQFVNEKLLGLIVRVAAASQFGDAATVESSVCHRQPLPFKSSGVKAQPIVV